MSARDERILQFMQQSRPVTAIALLEGIADDYARKETKRLAAEHGIDYKPVPMGPEELAPGLTDVSRQFRSNLGTRLHNYRNNRPAPHPLEVAFTVGINQADQTRAENRPNGYDWRLSQMERLMQATNVDFTTAMITALLDGPTLADKARLAKVLACLNS